MKNIKILILSILVVVALGAVAIYVYPFHAGARRDKRSVEKMFAQQQLYQYLNLTQRQRQMLEENKNKNKEQMKVLFQTVREKMILIRQELQKDPLDMGKIDQTNAELKQLQAQILDVRLEGILEVRKILTPEQFKKFSAKMEERANAFRNKWRRPEEKF